MPNLYCWRENPLLNIYNTFSVSPPPSFTLLCTFFHLHTYRLFLWRICCKSIAFHWRTYSFLKLWTVESLVPLSGSVWSNQGLVTTLWRFRTNRSIHLSIFQSVLNSKRKYVLLYRKQGGERNVQSEKEVPPPLPKLVLVFNTKIFKYYT